VNGVGPCPLRQLRRPPRVLDRDPVLDPELPPVEPAPDREVVADSRLHRVNHLHEQTRAILDGTAVLVLASVARRREEGGDEVAVGGVDLDSVEARAPRSLGCLREPTHELPDVRLRHLVVGDPRARLREVAGDAADLVGSQIVEQIDRARSRLGRDPHRSARRHVLRCDLSRVLKLNGDRGPVRVDPVGEPPKSRYEGIV
jgi:hypothetical protein